MNEASPANGLADATVPASQVLPECDRQASTGKFWTETASPGHLVTAATILLDNASYLVVYPPWLQSDQIAAQTVDGLPRHLLKEDVTPEMCMAALRQHVALANRDHTGSVEGFATGQAQAHSAGSAAGRPVVHQTTSSAPGGTASSANHNQTWDPGRYPTKFNEHENLMKARHQAFLEMLRSFPEQQQAFRTLHELITSPLDGDDTIVRPILPKVDVDADNWYLFGQKCRCKSRLGISLAESFAPWVCSWKKATMQKKSEWAKQMLQTIQTITRFFTFPNSMSLLVANMHNVTNTFRDTADGELAVALIAWKATLAATKAFPGCVVLQSPPPAIWEEGRVGPGTAEATSRLNNKETYYELCDREVMQCSWVTVVNYTMATCLLKRHQRAKDAEKCSEFYCHGNTPHFGDTAEGLQLLGAHWACIMTYLNLMRLWPARNVLASVHMTIAMRTFVIDANVTSEDKTMLNDRFLSLQKMKVAGDNLFKKFAPPAMPIPAASLENFTNTQVLMQEPSPPPQASLTKSQIQMILERATCTVMPSDISLRVNESLEDDGLMEVGLDISRIQIVTLEQDSLADVLCDVDFNQHWGGREKFIDAFRKDADCYSVQGSQEESEQPGYALGFLYTEFFKDIKSQTLEKMVGIDIYEADVTISIELGYHCANDAETITRTIQSAISDATDSTNGVGWLLTTRTMSQDISAEQIIPKKTNTGYSTWTIPGGAPTLHTNLVDLTGHVRDGDCSHNDSTAEWKSAFGMTSHDDNESPTICENRYVKVGTSTEMMQTMHKVADNVPLIPTLYAILAKALAESTYWRENGCLIRSVSDLLHVRDGGANRGNEEDINVTGATNSPSRVEDTHARIMVESATYMRPANQAPVQRDYDLSHVPSIPEVQHLVGFANETLPGSIRQLRTIGLPLTICSQEASSERGEKPYKCIKICAGRTTVPWQCRTPFSRPTR